MCAFEGFLRLINQTLYLMGIIENSFALTHKPVVAFQILPVGTLRFKLRFNVHKEKHKQMNVKTAF